MGRAKLDFYGTLVAYGIDIALREPNTYAIHRARRGE